MIVEEEVSGGMVAAKSDVEEGTVAVSRRHDVRSLCADITALPKVEHRKAEFLFRR
jgi:hypothetical protein